jgi:hypothetical protein
MQGPPFLFGSRLADGFQSAKFFICELQRLAPLQEGHSPLKHFRVEMYRYLENDRLVLLGHKWLAPAWRGHL